ncbi:hypothetical protein EUTSA_v10016047mg, partial [Eutrema salsugineum]
LSVFFILPFSSFSEKSEPDFNLEDIICKPSLDVNDRSEPGGLEGINDLDINTGSCKQGFEVRLGSVINTDFSKPGLEERTVSDINMDFSKPDLEMRTESDVNMGFNEPVFGLSWEPGLEFPKRIKMMMKLQKRNMNEEFDAVLLTNSKTESITILRNRE